MEPMKRAWILLTGIMVMLLVFGSFEHLTIYQIGPVNSAIHTIIEVLVILITLIIALQGWIIYPYYKSGRNLFLGGLFFAVGLLLLMHLLFYKGMPLNMIWNSNEMSMFFSVVARYLEAFGILVILFIKDSILEKLKRYPFYLFSLSLIITVGTFLFLITYYFPNAIDNIFYSSMITYNYKIIFLLHSIAWIKVIVDIALNKKSIVSFFIYPLTFLIYSDIIYLVGGIFFEVFILYNLGHVFRLVGYYFIFNANYVTTVESPFIQKNIAEKESFENKQQLDWMLELIPGAFHTVNHHFIITSANTSFCHLIGESEAHIVGQNIVDLLRKKGVDEKDIPCTKAVTEGKTLVKEKVRIDQRILQADVIPIIDKTTSEIVGAASYCFDITEEETESKKQRILLEEYLNQTQNLHHLIEAIPISFLAIDNNGVVVHANERSLNFLGFNSLEELIGSNLDQIADKLETTKDNLFIYNALMGEEIININGKINQREMLINAYPIRSRLDSTIILGAIALYQDITELQILRSEIENMERLNLVGQMAASITHEIRNPMATVRGFIQLIKEDSSKKQEYYDIIIDELDRANSIINDFLSLSHTRVIEVKEYNLNEIIKEVHPILIADANIKGQYVELNLEKNLEKLKLNKKEMKQLILNLARNGSESMTNGGILTISTRKLHGGVELRITDTGHGIPKDRLDKLFIPFFTTKDGGTGLGLSVSKSIVEKHNAEIFVETKEGLGTTFVIYFRY